MEKHKHTHPKGTVSFDCYWCKMTHIDETDCEWTEDVE